MKKYYCLLVAIISIICSQFVESHEIIESNSIKKVIPLIDKDTWFLVDLDNTVFQTKQALGHVDWFAHEVEKLITLGKSREDAFHSLYPLWIKAQMLTEVMPVEKDFPEAIKQLQKRNIVVMGLTHRQIFIIPETLRQVNSLGLDLRRTAPSQQTINIQDIRPSVYTEGILFVDDFNSKGERLISLLKKIDKKPKKIVFIDDKKKNVEDVAKAASSLGIEYIGIYYTATEHQPKVYVPELAEYQLRFFDAIMSNSQAQQLALQIIKEKEVQEKQESSIPEYLYLIVSAEQWRESLMRNQLISSSFAEEYMELLTKDHVTAEVQKHWNQAEHVIVKLTSKKLIGRLNLDSRAKRSTPYYQLHHGSIPLDAVAEVSIIHINEELKVS